MIRFECPAIEQQMTFFPAIFCDSFSLAFFPIDKILMEKTSITGLQFLIKEAEGERERAKIK